MLQWLPDKTQWPAELKALFWLGFPVVLANLARIGFHVSNSIFLGRVRDMDVEESLGAASLAVSWMNCSIYFGVGLVFALDTFLSQAFGASTQPL